MVPQFLRVRASAMLQVIQEGVECRYAPGTEPWRRTRIRVNLEPNLTEHAKQRILMLQDEYWRVRQEVEAGEVARVAKRKREWQEGEKRPSTRPDLAAMKLLKASNHRPRRPKIAGHVPGIAVNDE